MNELLISHLMAVISAPLLQPSRSATGRCGGAEYFYRGCIESYWYSCTPGLYSSPGTSHQNHAWVEAWAQTGYLVLSGSL